MKATLHPNVQALVQLVSQGEARFAGTTGVKVSVANGIYRLDATDGRCAGIIQGPNEAPKFDRGDVLENMERTEAIVSAEDWKNVFKTGKKTDEVYVVTEGDGRGLVLARGLAFTKTLALDGKFPPVDQVIPRRSPSFSVAVDPAYLIDLLQVAVKLTDDEQKRVTLTFYPNAKHDGGIVGIVAKNSAGQTLDGLLVPLEVPKADKAKPHAANGQPGQHA